MEVSRPGVKLELKLSVYTTAMATQDLSCIWDLHYSSQQCQILNLLSKARDQNHNLMVSSRICFHCAMMGTPLFLNLFRISFSLLIAATCSYMFSTFSIGALSILIIIILGCWSSNSSIPAIPDSSSDVCSVSSNCVFRLYLVCLIIIKSWS